MEKLVNLLNSVLMSGISFSGFSKEVDIDSVKFRGLLSRLGYRPVTRFIKTEQVFRMNRYRKFNEKRLLQDQGFVEVMVKLKRVQRGYMKTLITGSKGKRI